MGSQKNIHSVTICYFVVEVGTSPGIRFKVVKGADPVLRNTVEPTATHPQPQKQPNLHPQLPAVGEAVLARAPGLPGYYTLLTYH